MSSTRHKPIKSIIAREGLIIIGLLVIGLAICLICHIMIFNVIPILFNRMLIDDMGLWQPEQTFHMLKRIGFYFALGGGYASYLLIRFIMWAVKASREK